MIEVKFEDKRKKIDIDQRDLEKVEKIDIRILKKLKRQINKRR